MTCPLPLVPRPSTPRPSQEPVVHQKNDRSIPRRRIVACVVSLDTIDVPAKM